MKFRCEMVAKGLNAKYKIDVGALAPLPADVNWEDSKATLDANDKPLVDAVNDLAAQTGNPPLAVAADVAQRRVTVWTKDRPWWQAVDELCARAGLTCAPDPDSGDITFARASRPSAHVTPGPWSFIRGATRRARYS